MAKRAIKEMYGRVGREDGKVGMMEGRDGECS